MHIANSAICILDVRDVPSGDVSATVSIKFFGKKTVRIKIRYLALKKNILLLVSTRNDNISRGCATKTEFPEGRGGSVLGVNFWKIQRGGEVIGKIPSVGGGGMDVFWNYTILVFTKKRTVIRGCNSWLDSDSKAGEW